MTVLNGFVSPMGETIVEKMNLAKDSEFESALTGIVFYLSSLYAYSGLFIMAYYK